MDPVDDVFAAMRVESALYARLDMGAPWGVNFAAGVSARFGLVLSGACWLSADQLPEPVRLVPGDCYVLARGSSYRLQDDPRSSTRNCFDLIGDRVGGVVEGG